MKKPSNLGRSLGFREHGIVRVYRQKYTGQHTSMTGRYPTERSAK